MIIKASKRNVLLIDLTESFNDSGRFELVKCLYVTVFVCNESPMRNPFVAVTAVNMNRFNSPESLLAARNMNRFTSSASISPDSIVSGGEPPTDNKSRLVGLLLDDELFR